MSKKLMDNDYIYLSTNTSIFLPNYLQENYYNVTVADFIALRISLA